MPATSVAPYPAALSAEEGAAIWVQYLTGYFALVDVGRLGEGNHVLITAASSSTGVAAIQLAHALGAKAVATTRTMAKQQALLDAGADAVVVTQEQDLVARDKEVTNGQSADVVYDPVGGPQFEQLLDVAARGGRIIEYGLLDPRPATLSIGTLLMKGLSVHAYVVFAFTGCTGWGLPPQTEAVERAKRFIYDGLESGKLTLRIAKTFPLEQVADAHRYMESNQQIGKIVVTTR